MPYRYASDNDTFKFDQLDPKLQAKVLDKNREINVEVDFDWHAPILEDWTAKLEDIGFPDPEIRFSGFYNQGDGACFSCGWMDLSGHMLSELMPKDLQKKLGILDDEDRRYNYSCQITTSGRYSHEKTMTADWDARVSSAAQDKIFGDFCDEVLLEKAQDLARDIYQDLKKAYEYLTSDEQVKETILSNEYEFDAEGHMV
jgi:hypothetical protein